MTKVLVVDDTSYTRVVIRKILESSGFEVIGEAENGVEAIEQYRLLKPDVVFMDIVMPEMDGLEALAQIRKVDSTASVIMCTAIGQEKTLMRAIRAGACDYVLKPPSAERVLNAIRAVLNLRAEKGH